MLRNKNAKTKKKLIVYVNKNSESRLEFDCVADNYLWLHISKKNTAKESFNERLVLQEKPLAVYILQLFMGLSC